MLCMAPLGPWIWKIDVDLIYGCVGQETGQGGAGVVLYDAHIREAAPLDALYEFVHALAPDLDADDCRIWVRFREVEEKIAPARAYLYDHTPGIQWFLGCGIEKWCLYQLNRR